MRPSPQRHTLAVLRLTLGFTQKEMADLAECSTPTIQAIELGKLQMSGKLAERISFETGVNLAWLLANNVDQPIIGIKKEPYTKDSFAYYQANKKNPDVSAEDVLMRAALTIHTGLIASILLEAYKNGRWRLCDFKLSQALKNLVQEFGQYKTFGDITSKDIGVLDWGTGKPFNIQFIANEFHETLKQLTPDVPPSQTDGDSELLYHNAMVRLTPSGSPYSLGAKEKKPPKQKSQQRRKKV